MSNDNSSGGGRSLGGGPAERLPRGWGSSSSGPRIGRIGGAPTAPRNPVSSSSGPRIASLRDLGSSAPSGPPPGPRIPQDDDNDDERFPAGGEQEEWFTGGGLNVENPDAARNRESAGGDTVRDILRKASQAPRAVDETVAPTPGRSVFSGSGNTLGSDEIESKFIPDPDASSGDNDPDHEDTAVRNLVFWRNGFSIEDGPLLEYSNPENQRILDAINNGNAPPTILNVRVNQPVELRVARRMDEDYQPQPKVSRPFDGSGNRLGGVTPDIVSSSSGANVPGAYQKSSAPPAGSAPVPAGQTKFEVNNELPTTSVQIRLADGTRLVSRMNLTHTVGDIRAFIIAARPTSEQRAFTIGTTFPNKTLDDDNSTIEAAKLQNAVIVQRWA